MADEIRRSPRTPYTLKSPCANCPFRADKPFYLGAERAEEIADSLRDGSSFYCHKTIAYGDESDERENECEDEDEDEKNLGQGEITSRSRMCAGALITLEREDSPNQIMRIAERLGLYDRSALDMDAPVYGSLDEWQASFRDKP